MTIPPNWSEKHWAEKLLRRLNEIQQFRANNMSKLLLNSTFKRHKIHIGRIYIFCCWKIVLWSCFSVKEIVSRCFPADDLDFSWVCCTSINSSTISPTWKLCSYWQISGANLAVFWRSRSRRVFWTTADGELNNSS